MSSLEGMRRTAARLRADLARLEQPVLVRLEYGPRVIPRRPDPMRRAVLMRELRRVEATIAAAATPERRRLVVLVVLVGCVAAKRPAERDERGLPRHWPAADLYTSDLFRKRRAYAERHAPDAWGILSAQHGFLDPDDPTAPYDFRLSELNARERWGWARRCASRVLGFGPANTLRVELHAGELYCRDLAVELARDGAEVVRPVQGMPIGEQLRWYRQQQGQQPDAPVQLDLWAV